MPDSQNPNNMKHLPLITPGFIWKTVIILICLVLITVLFAVVGRHIGARISLSGHTENTKKIEIIIANDVIKLSKNVIRFEKQRQAGLTKRVELYFQWPKMAGYSDNRKMAFNSSSKNSQIIYLSLQKRDVARDMSGRFRSAYSILLKTNDGVGKSGLTAFTFKERHGYNQEKLYVSNTLHKKPYVIRCFFSAQIKTLSTATEDQIENCQRDVFIGKTLIAKYRFSGQLLPQWEKIDHEIKSYLHKRLVQ